MNRELLVQKRPEFNAHVEKFFRENKIIRPNEKLNFGILFFPEEDPNVAIEFTDKEAFDRNLAMPIELFIEKYIDERYRQRVTNIFTETRLDIFFVGLLVRTRESLLSKHRNCGKATLGEVREGLSKLQLCLGMIFESLGPHEQKALESLEISRVHDVSDNIRNTFVTIGDLASASMEVIRHKFKEKSLHREIQKIRIENTVAEIVRILRKFHLKGAFEQE